jgi:multidrug efflux pump subunit AcrA (membrane-fusion protein)
LSIPIYYPATPSKPLPLTMPDISKRRLSSDAKTEAIKYVCSLVIIALAVGLYFLLGSFAEKPATKDSNALIPQVSTETVTPYFGALDLVIPGSVKPHREIKVSAEVVGKIVTKHPEFQAGNFVLAGTPLAEIDAQDYQADLNTLAADVEQARKRIIENQRQIEGEKRNLELAKQDFEIQKRDFAPKDWPIRCRGRKSTKHAALSMPHAPISPRGKTPSVCYRLPGFAYDLPWI